MIGVSDLNGIGDIGAAGIFVILILRSVFEFVNRNKDKCQNGVACRFTHYQQKQLDDLHLWHSPNPETGRFEWYDRSGNWTELLRTVNDSIVAQTATLRELCEEMRLLRDENRKRH